MRERWIDISNTLLLQYFDTFNFLFCTLQCRFSFLYFLSLFGLPVAPALTPASGCGATMPVEVTNQRCVAHRGKLAVLCGVVSHIAVT